MSHIFTQKQLEKDNSRVIAIFMVQVLLLFVLWTMWVIRGHIVVYEMSAKADVISENLVRAEFPLSSSASIHRGQVVQIEFDNQPWPAYEKISGVVKHINPNSDNRVLHVYVDIVRSKIKPKQKSIVHRMSGKVLIEVGQKTPWEIIINNFGKAINQTET